MNLPKLVLLDRDGCLNYSSPEPDHPLYYITRVEDLVIKIGVREAVQLIKALGIPMVLVTRQRCISKGLVARKVVDLIHARLERLLDVHFDSIFVEEGAEDKTRILNQVKDKYHGVYRPDQMAFFDDSPRDVKIAHTMNIAAYDGSNLFKAIKPILYIS